MKQKIRQCLSLLLVLAMCVSQIPINALAAGMDSGETENVTASNVSKTVENQTEEDISDTGKTAGNERSEETTEEQISSLDPSRNVQDSEVPKAMSLNSETEIDVNQQYTVNEINEEVSEDEADVLFSNSEIASLSCSSFISNTTHREYIDMMMRYYISSNSNLQKALTEGKNVIFMFEGGSDNYPETSYKNVPTNIRNQAVVIVVKKDSNGKIGIATYCEECSSVPGNPENTSGASGDRSTTLMDGIYKVSTVNHKGMYGALWVNNNIGYYTPPDNKDGLTNGASGINIHTRSSEKAGGDNWSWAWSEGCQVIGTGNDSSNYFNTFMKVVTGIDYNVWTYYVGSSSSGNQLATITTGIDVGYYVIDRQLALDGLSELYNSTALKNITSVSKEAYNRATADKEDPVISNLYVSNIPTDRSGFTLSFTATDNVGVTSVYAMVREQGWSEDQALRINGTLPDSNGTATVTVDINKFDGFQGNYYATCYAEDAAGNKVHWEINGQSTDNNPITLYQSVVDDGTYKVTLDGASVRNAPYSEVNGEDTRVYRLSLDEKISITGSFANDHNNLWYQLQDGNWIYSGNVKLYTKWSEMADYFKNLLSNTIFFIYGQAVKPSTNARAASNYSSAALPGTLVSDSNSGNNTVSYTVYFNANGGQSSWTSKNVVVGLSYGSMPTPNRFGYSFDGWFTDAEGGNQVTSGTTCNLAGNQTLYAHWTRIVLLEGTCGENLSFILYGDGELDITGSGEMTSHPWTNDYAQRVVIVNLPEGLTSICDSAFSGCAYLENIEIPDAVTGIGDCAFANAGLTSLELPSELISVGRKILEGTSNVTEITIPQNVTKLNGVEGYYDTPHGSFENSSIQTVVFEDGLTAIPSYAFQGCSTLENVTIPDTVTTIGTSAFINCTALVAIKIPNSVMSIGDCVFANTGLTSLTLPSGLTSVGRKILEGTTGVTEITVPKNVTKLNGVEGWYDTPHGSFENSSIQMAVFESGLTAIPSYAFQGCSTLENVTIPNTVTSIGASAFIDCTALTTIEIPNSVTLIGDCVFSNTGLTSLTLPNRVVSVGRRILEGTADVTEITIPKSVTKLNGVEGWYDTPHGSFENSSIKTVIFESGLTNIPSYALQSCGTLENVVIPDTVTSIGTSVFNSCTTLTSISIPDTVTAIGNSAFANSGLEQIKMPDSVNSLGTSVFQNCTNLTAVTWNNTLTSVPNNTFNGCTALTSFELRSVITSLGTSAFNGCTSLTEIKWNENLKTIEESAFSNCDAIISLSISEPVTKIGASAFYNCDSLESVEMANTVTSIGNQAFYNCDALTKVTIPGSVTSMGTSMFYDCDALTDVTLGTGLTSIPNSTFEHCDALETVVLPYRVASIGASAFKNDVALKSIFIPRATNTIDSTAFSYPDKMTIYGVAGTYAETFANTNGYTFVDQSVPATAVKLTPSEVTINKGQSTNLTMTVTPENFTDEVFWKSTDTSIATISDTGVVKGIAVGTATIKLMVGDVSANCKVTVVQPVTSISLNKTSLTMEALDTYQLIATANPNTAANRDIIWSTSDESIAAVDETGLVTAFGKGSATITATAADGSGVTKSCTVTVTNTAHIAATVDELESAHNYPNSCSDFWVYTLAGAEKLSVTFDTRTNIEEDFDFLYIYDGEGNQIGKYTGTELAGQTVEVPGDTVRIKLVSDSSGTAWGFKVSNIRKPAIVLANGTCGENMTWTMYEDGLLTINGTGDMKTYTYTREVPWYSYIGQITAVQIEEGVTSISSFAFYGITGLREIMIPEGVKTLGAYAFKNSTALESVGLPTTLSKIGESAFYGCTNLKTIAIPEGIYTIWAYTFKNCTSLASVTLPQSLIKIDEAAFYGCSSLAELLIPDSVSIVGIYAFKNCTKLKELTLPVNLTEVREAAFYATAMETLNIPSGVTKIGPYAFKNCTALSSLNLPEHLTSIGEAAFYASSIETLTVPDAVTKIGPYAFKNCAQLKNVTLPASLEAISESCFYSCTALETIALPDNVTVVGNYAFRKCTSLKHVSFPKRLNIVGESSFYGCTALTEISLSEGVTSILSYAFKGCTALASVTLPSTLKRIGGSAFHSCTILGGITIPANVTEISGYCFSGNIKLREITFEGSAPAFGADVFKNVTAKAYYPSIDSSWTDAVKQNYGGSITWLAK